MPWLWRCSSGTATISWVAWWCRSSSLARMSASTYWPTRERSSWRSLEPGWLAWVAYVSRAPCDRSPPASGRWSRRSWAVCGGQASRTCSSSRARTARRSTDQRSGRGLDRHLGLRRRGRAGHCDHSCPQGHGDRTGIRRRPADTVPPPLARSMLARRRRGRPLSVEATLRPVRLEAERRSICGMNRITRLDATSSAPLRRSVAPQSGTAPLRGQMSRC
jgi:hypothetical protein